MTDYMAAATAKLEERARVFEARKAVLDGDGTNAEKRAAVERIYADMASLEAEARAYVEKAEQRSAIAESGVRLNAGQGEVRAADLLSYEIRAITGAASIGSAFTPAENANFWVDFLANEAVMLKTGVNVIRTKADSLAIPHLLTGGTAVFASEGAAGNDSNPTGETITATPRRIMQTTVLSNEVMADSSPAILDALASSMVRTVGLAFDAACFEGSGTAPAIRGLKNIAGISTVSLGANGASLASIDVVADALTVLAANGANPDTAVIVCAPRVWGAIMKIRETSTSNKSIISDGAGSASSPITRNLYGRPLFLSNQLSLNETQGTSSDASSMYIFSPEQLWAVIREDSVFEANTSEKFSSYQTVVRAVLRADLVAPNPGAIVRVTGIRP